MAQLTTGNTWSTGDTVTAAKLNLMINDATLQAGAITSQGLNSSPALADQFLIVTAAGDLYRTTLQSIASSSAEFNANKIQSKSVSTASPANDEILVYDSSSQTWNFESNIATPADLSVTTGKVEDDAITLAKLEDGTQGDILYYGASGAPARLGFGTSGQVLKTQGTGANPVWSTLAAPAFAQAMLTGTQDVYNHSSYSVDPVEGAVGDDEAFWLVEDDNSDSMDLSLTVASGSKVKLTVDLETDTNNGTVAVAARVQRTVDSGTTWTDLPTGDAASTRVRVAFTNHHGTDHRNNGRSTWHYIDSPASTSVRYRVIYTCHPDYHLYLNREYSLDNDGDSGGVTTAEYRSTSYFLAEEIQQ